MLMQMLMLVQVSSPLLPLLAIMLFSYGVAHAFMTVSRYAWSAPTYCIVTV